MFVVGQSCGYHSPWVIMFSKWFTGSWGWRGCTSPSVQQPHAEQKCVRVPLVYLTIIFWNWRCAYTKQIMRVVPLLSWNVFPLPLIHCPLGGSRGQWICENYMWLIAKSGCRYRQHGTTATEACAFPVTQCELDYEMLRWTLCSSLFVDRGFFTAELLCSSKWPWNSTTEVMFTVEINMIL